MDDRAAAVGHRVRFWRVRRNLSRKQFADMVGRSTSWLDKIENGERQLVRLPMMELVAEVLAVDVSVLTDDERSGQASACVDAAEVFAIRSALSTYPALRRDGSEPPISVAAVKHQAEYLDMAWLSSHFTVVAQHLPRLIAAAQHAALTSTDETRVEAHRALVTTYRLASSLLLKFEANDVAWLAADRAMTAGSAVDDTWSMARATRCVARALNSTEQRTHAIDTLLVMADRMRGEALADPDQLLALYGMLYLAAAVTAASRDDAAVAQAMHDEAMVAARRFEPHFQTHRTFFGVTNTLIHRVSALVRLHEAGKALEFARTINPADVAALPAERQANYLLDLTEAHAGVGEYRQAVRSLSRAEQIAPEEVRCRPLAHGLLRQLLGNTRGESAAIVKQMAHRAGVAA